MIRARAMTESPHFHWAGSEVRDGLHDTVLRGCASAPLASYLKALGIFRLVGEQADPEVRGRWEAERFLLRSSLSQDDLVEFFLHSYEPTPILSPWSGRAGFLEGESAGVQSTRKGARILRALASTTAPRFAPYRDLVREAKADELLTEWDLITAERKQLNDEKKKKGLSAEERAAIDERLKELAAREKPSHGPSLKEQVIAGLRARLPDKAVAWIDTCFAVAEDIRVGALLGTGGNEGSMDFSINHLDTLLQMFDGETGSPHEGVAQALRGSLFGETVQQWKGVNPGLLAPASVGGPNMGTGFDGELHENPWDAVLMLEGALFFSAAVTRRHGASPGGGLSFPFALAPVNAGHGAVSRTEAARPEIWAPLWHRAASLEEVAALFAEGRLTLGRRPARNALDATRAVARLGADRGIDAFERFGFYERRGQGYYVTVPLGRHRVGNRPGARLVDNLDEQGWLTNFRRQATAKGASARLISLVRRVEDAVFAVTTDVQPGSSGMETRDPVAVQRLLIALGEAQLYMARSPSTRAECRPLPPLKSDWLYAANDESIEFAIAAALAGLHGFAPGFEGRVRPTLPMAAHFAPLQSADASPVDEHNSPSSQQGIRTAWQSGWDETSAATNQVVWGPGSLERNLAAVLRRRLVESERRGLIDKPLRSWSHVPLGHVESWLLQDVDEDKIARLLPALSLLTLAPVGNQVIGTLRAGAAARLPLAYVVLKPLFCTESQLRRVGLLAPGMRLPLSGEPVAHLLAGRVDLAVATALRRLQIIGFARHFDGVAAGDLDPLRLAAALMIPITDAGITAIAKRIGFVPPRKTDETVEG